MSLFGDPSWVKIKQIKLVDPLTNTKATLELNVEQTRDQFVNIIINTFNCHSIYYPSHILINDQPIGLNPRFLFHQVDEKEEYKLGYFTMPFENSNHFAKCSSEALETLQSNLLDQMAAFIRTSKFEFPEPIQAQQMNTIINRGTTDPHIAANDIYFTTADQTLNDVIHLAKYAKSSWKLLKVDKEVQVYRNDERSKEIPNSSCRCMKGVMKMRIQPKIVKNIILRRNAYYKHYNKLLREYRRIAKLDAYTQIVYLKYSAKQLFTEQVCDFVILYHVRTEADGTIIIAGKSVEHPDAPPTYGVHRGTAHTSGYIIEPLDDSDDPISKVTYISHIDLGYNLPKIFVNMIETSQPMLLCALREFIDINRPRLTRKKSSKKTE